MPLRPLQLLRRRIHAPRFSTSRARSPHAVWYAEVFPAMIPIALLGSSVYIALQLVQTHLSRERYLDEAHVKVAQLEKELDAIRARKSDAEAAEQIQKKSSRWF